MALKDISINTAQSHFSPLIKEIEDAKKGFGKTLALAGFGKEAAPIFDRQEDWQELSKRWRQRKRSYPKNKFYRGLSEGSESLRNAIFNMPSERIFGQTQVRARMAQVETDGFYNPRIKKQIDTVFRDDRGRFARNNPLARQQVMVQIIPFPNVRDGDYIDALPIAENQKKKLWYNNAARPLIEPYTEWVFNRKIRTLINSRIGAMK